MYNNLNKVLKDMEILFIFIREINCGEKQLFTIAFQKFLQRKNFLQKSYI